MEKSLELVLDMLDHGYEDSLLLSQDAGWYHVGEPGGGQIRSYADLFREFIPALRSAGAGESLVRKLTVSNPARAFAFGNPGAG